MVIRHAEKPDHERQGVTIHGTPDKDSLIARGWQRASALVVLFHPTDGPLQNSNLAVPTVIYASSPEKDSKANDTDKKEGSKSKRPLQTIKPLADRIGIQPRAKRRKWCKACSRSTESS